MAVNHEYEVVEKEVVFTAGVPTIPHKLFDVNGHVLAFVVGCITSPFNTEEAVLAIKEQNGSTLWNIPTKMAEISRRNHRVIKSDLYMGVIADVPGIGEPSQDITSGTMKFYCIFARLSVGSSVEAG